MKTIKEILDEIHNIQKELKQLKKDIAALKDNDSNIVLIDELNIDNRVKNILKSKNINTVNRLILVSDTELLNLLDLNCEDFQLVRTSVYDYIHTHGPIQGGLDLDDFVEGVIK